MFSLQIEEELSHIQPASCFCKSPAGLQVSSKVLIAVDNKYRELLDEYPEVMKPSKFVFLDPTASQRKLNRYFQRFHRIRNYIRISKGYWLNYCLCEIVAWPLMSSQEDTAVAQLHSASD